MWNKLFIVLFRVLGVLGVFVAPVIYLVVKFGGSETTTVQVTENSMPMVILLIITILGIGFVLWLVSSVRVIYAEELRKHPFGTVSVFTFGVVIFAITMFLGQWLDKISDLVKYNAEQFANDIDLYNQTISILGIYVIIGLLFTVASFIWQKAI